jgi:tRNA pseudouridine55 synthase
MDGVLVVHKPVGPSSHDVVVVARRSLGISRIGHTGTLDPQASGVLPLVLGQATRLAQHLTGSDKEYTATLRFGVVTDTYDAAGEVLDSRNTVPTAEEIQAALTPFRGTFEQRPPVYSAKMVDGERSYVRARAGKPIQSPAVPVTVHALELVAFDPPLARVRVRCSAGFYVRSLAHDLGQALGTGAILAGLVRTEAAGFTLDNAIAFENLVQAPRTELRARVRPMEALLIDVPAAQLTEEGLDWARHGRELGPRQLHEPLSALPPLTRLFGPDGRLVGLARRGKMPGFLHPTVVFSYN